MSQSEKFSFATSFDNLEDLSPNDTVYTAAAREEGNKLGYAEGHQKGLEEGHGDVLEVVRSLSHKLSDLNEQYEICRRTLHEEVVKTSYFMMKSLFPKYAEAFGQKEIETIVMESLKEQENDKRICIKVAESVKSPLEKVIGEVKSEGNSFGDIHIQVDKSLGVMDCQLSWEQGGVDRLVCRIWEQIRTAASRHVSLEEIEKEVDGVGEKESHSDGETPAQEPQQEQDNELKRKTNEEQETKGESS